MLQAFSSGAQPVTMIGGGYGHSLFLKSDGSLWVMGFDNDGQLGDGAWPASHQPPRKDCGYQRNCDCRRTILQPVYHEWRAVGHGL